MAAERKNKFFGRNFGNDNISFLQRYGRPIYLDTDEGINLLGNTVEANAFSVNPEYYGYHGIHNNGHNIISLSLDPRNELGIPPGKYLKQSIYMV